MAADFAAVDTQAEQQSDSIASRSAVKGNRDSSATADYLRRRAPYPISQP